MTRASFWSRLAWKMLSVLNWLLRTAKCLKVLLFVCLVLMSLVICFYDENVWPDTYMLSMWEMFQAMFSSLLMTGSNIFGTFSFWLYQILNSIINSFFRKTVKEKLNCSILHTVQIWLNLPFPVTRSLPTCQPLYHQLVCQHSDSRTCLATFGNLLPRNRRTFCVQNLLNKVVLRNLYLKRLPSSLQMLLKHCKPTGLLFGLLQNVVSVVRLATEIVWLGESSHTLNVKNSNKAVLNE